MTDEKVLADFEKTNMGWLSESGEILPCALHEHLEALAHVKRFAREYGYYVGTCDANERAMQEDLDALGPDEHPSMHRFDGMNDEARDRLVKVVYTAGWVRLGKSYDASDAMDISRREGIPLTQALRRPTAWYLEAEGLTWAVETHRRVLERFARDLGCRLVARGMRYEDVDFGNHRCPEVREVLVPDTLDGKPYGRS